MATITGTTGSDTLNGTAGADLFENVSGADLLDGLSGDDRFVFNSVSFVYPSPAVGLINGGDGFDTIDASGISPASFSAGQMVVGNQRYYVNSIEKVVLGSNSNLIFIENSKIQIVAGSGEDRFSVGGEVYIDAGGGNDYVFVSGDGTYEPERPTGVLSGGAGIDHLSTNILSNVDLHSGTLEVFGSKFTISGFENVTIIGYNGAGVARGDDGRNVLTIASDSYAGGTLEGRGGDDSLTGSHYRDRLDGGAGNDKISGLDGADLIWGGAGDDLIVAQADGDIIDGGSGFDVVAYSRLARSYVVNHADSTATVRGNGLSDAISNVEDVRFADATLTFDPDSNAAFVMRLYDTVLSREPDAFGLDSWLDTLDGTATKADVAAGFVNAPEFAAKTGDLSNADFVEFLYGSALGRASDVAGKTSWISILESGQSRADVLIGFSESDEHRIQTQETLSNGLWLTDENYQQVTALYDTFANRLPDMNGLLDWVGRLESGATLSEVAAGFAGSAEFAGRTADLSNPEIVDFMYRNTLDREADLGGKQNWVDALDAGLSRGDLLLGFSSSSEHLAMMSSDIFAGVSFA